MVNMSDTFMVAGSLPYLHASFDWLEHKAEALSKRRFTVTTSLHVRY
jgi:hypothetical protein